MLRAACRRASAVHATHVDSHDISLLAASGSTVVMCPTTERDLGDGLGPTSDLAEAGVSMALGSDSHAIIDLLEEARSLELDERLRTRSRIHQAADLLAMATVNGHRSLGWGDAGSITIGSRADLVTLGLGSVRLAGADATTGIESVIFAGSTADVTDVVVDGRAVVVDGAHATVEVASELDAAIRS
ncbi:MAG: amidohydrolase family protein [Acidimicrobiales bacterium]